jgi:hypothetical protein
MLGFSDPYVNGRRRREATRMVKTSRGQGCGAYAMMSCQTRLTSRGKTICRRDSKGNCGVAHFNAYALALEI